MPNEEKGVVVKITKTQTIKTGDEKPDAIEIKVDGITVLVNMHTGIVSVEGADHTHTAEDAHNTLVVKACASSPVSMLGKAALDAYANGGSVHKDPRNLSVRELLDMDPAVVPSPSTILLGLVGDLLDTNYPASKMRHY